ncbi:alpha-sarcoglycan isoform X1 [Ambystoma mexicanum]|uniref:alpha-sarcoglycan isoform X1 n=1 Tax=Ambystoma mexicanum TaxID=8296 RepID=UPI0037E7E54B
MPCIFHTGILWFASADRTAFPSAGTLFVHELEKGYFQRKFPSANNYGVVRNDPVTFRANLQGFPDLPGWLRHIQRDPYQNGYLYGSPTATEIGKHIIEVTAYNRNTFETFGQKIIFNVSSSLDLHTSYHVEFFVKNRNVEEILNKKAHEKFQYDLDALWKQEPFNIINITSALDRGGRVPLPIEGRKEGVYVRVGSDVPFPECLQEIYSKENQERCRLGGQPALPCYDTFAPDVRIDWCNVTLINLTGAMATQEPPTPGDGVMEAGSEFDPPSESPEGGEFISDYLLTILLPLLLALLLTLILSYIMCCRREGVDKRDAKTPDIQMLHHQTIHANTEELREMSRGRDVPRPLSTLPMFNVRTGERPSPMPQHRDSARVPLILAQK